MTGLAVPRVDAERKANEMPIAAIEESSRLSDPAHGGLESKRETGDAFFSVR
jgi:hypothetical protein